jgi:hypothetical protein
MFWEDGNRAVSALPGFFGGGHVMPAVYSGIVWGYSAVGLSSSGCLENYTEAQRCTIKGDVLVGSAVSKKTGRPVIGCGAISTLFCPQFYDGMTVPLRYWAAIW